MRRTRTLTCLLNVCMDSFGSYCMTTVFTQSHSDYGMKIIAQIQVFFLFSYDKHYLILHIFIFNHVEYQVVYLSIHYFCLKG